MESLFVIAVENAATKEIRYCIYEDGCGYIMSQSTAPYSLSHAAKFRSYDEAETVFNRFLAEKPNTYSDGVIMPPHHVWTGLGINNKNEQAEGTMAIVELVPRTVRSEAIAGRIKRPIGFTYKD